MSNEAWWEGKYKKVDGALEAVDMVFELSDLSVTDMFSKLHSIMSLLVDMHVPLSRVKKAIKRTSEVTFTLKRQRSIVPEYFWFTQDQQLEHLYEYLLLMCGRRQGEPRLTHE